MDVLTTIASLIPPIMLIMMICANKTRYDVALSIPVAGGKSYITKHLDANFIECACDNHNKLDAECFKKYEMILENTLDILGKTSKNPTPPIVMCRNYKLLKFLQPRKVYYFLGSKAYYDEVKLSIEDAKALQDYKDYLIANDKIGKAIQYNTKEELLAIIAKMFNLKQK